VVVFKFPNDPNVDYIKRIIGLPGDKIIYRNKQLYITEACDGQQPCPTGKAVKQIYSSKTDYISRGAYLEEYTEDLGDKNHSILRNPRAIDQTARYKPVQPGTAINEWIVPHSSYFAMGDNRDNSEDGRYWGFVPEANLVGEAVLIWVSFEFDRVPEDFLPTWLPSGIRFERSGSIQ
jgi:signal peptidase I